MLGSLLAVNLAQLIYPFLCVHFFAKYAGLD